MRESPFVFLRATFYWWIQRRQSLGGQVADAPRSLAVGDLHVENFGTWRDAEGRLARRTVIARDVSSRPGGWLLAAANAMTMRWSRIGASWKRQGRST